MGTGLAASAAHPRPNNIWVPPPPRAINSQRCSVRYRCTNYMAIAPSWFSVEHPWIVIERPSGSQLTNLVSFQFFFFMVCCFLSLTRLWRKWHHMALELLGFSPSIPPLHFLHLLPASSAVSFLSSTRSHLLGYLVNSLVTDRGQQIGWVSAWWIVVEAAASIHFSDWGGGGAKVILKKGKKKKYIKLCARSAPQK